MRLKLAQKFSVLMILGGFVSSASVSYSQTVDKPVEHPTLTVGDTWTYRTVDSWTDKELSQFKLLFTGKENERNVFSNTNKTTEKVTKLKTDLDLNVCRSTKGSTEILCSGVYKFPMFIDQKTTYEYSFKDGSYQAKCTVEEAEKVTVPAGVFDTLRIECNGFWGNFTAIPSASGRYKEIYWYAPSVKRYVKSYYQTSTLIGYLYSKQTTELLEYKVQ